MIFAPSPGELLFALLIFVVLPLTWIAGSIYILRRKIGSPPQLFLTWSAAFVLFYVGLILTIHISSSYVGAYTLTIKVVNPDRQPMANVVVNYTTFADPQCTWIGRYSPTARVSTATDQAGRLVINSYHGHNIDMTLQYSGYLRGSLFLAAAGSGFPHQLDGLQNISVSHGLDVASPPSDLKIAVEKAIALQVTMKPSQEKH